MSEDDSVKHEGKWTRADLPSWVKIRDADDMAGNGLRSRVIDIALNEVVEHLNAHYPKPAHRLLSSAAECVLGAEDRVRSAKAERDAAVTRAEQLEKQLAKVIQDVEDERDEWKARTEEAFEQGATWHKQSVPAVSRADIDRALINVTSNAMNYPTPSQMLGKDTGPLRRKCVDAVCDLLGIAAEQAEGPEPDPVEAAIRSGLSVWGTTDQAVQEIAASVRHVLGQEADQ